MNFRAVPRSLLHASHLLFCFGSNTPHFQLHNLEIGTVQF